MSRYKLRLEPQGIIPPDLDLTIKMQRKAEASQPTLEAGCVACCGGYLLDVGVNVEFSETLGEITVSAVGDFAFSIISTANLCGASDGVWHLIATDFAGGTIAIDHFDFDAAGRPRVFLTGNLSSASATSKALIFLTSAANGLSCIPLRAFGPSVTGSCQWNVDSHTGGGMVGDTYTGITNGPWCFPGINGEENRVTFSIINCPTEGETWTFQVSDMSTCLGDLQITDNGDGTVTVYAPTAADNTTCPSFTILAVGSLGSSVTPAAMEWSPCP